MSIVSKKRRRTKIVGRVLLEKKNENIKVDEIFQTPDDHFGCPNCGRIYKLRSSLRNHIKWECGKEPQFECLYCSYKAKQKMHMMRHMERIHKEQDVANLQQTILDLNIDFSKLIKDDNEEQ